MWKEGWLKEEYFLEWLAYNNGTSLGNLYITRDYKLGNNPLNQSYQGKIIPKTKVLKITIIDA